jgi:short-subunit dehydrogenase
MRIKLKPLNEQVIVITGASSGIGLATAKMAAGKGARVMLAARDGDALERAAAQMRADGGDARVCVTDVSREEDVRTLAAQAIEAFGGFDTWINNAGVGLLSPVEEVSSDDHHKVFETNYFGLVYGSLEAVRHFRETGRAGALINLGSAVSDMPMVYMVPYAATKHAIKGFTDGLRAELMRDRLSISVTLIKPSAIDTPFFEHAKSNMGGMAKGIGMFYTPEVVADAILFAAQHAKRDIAVGSTSALGGRISAVAPWIVDAQQGKIPIERLVDFGQEPIEDNLDGAPHDGHVRSLKRQGRPFSATTFAQTRTGLTSIALLAGAGAVAIALGGRRSH